MTTVERAVRVVDMRHPHAAGTTRTASDPVSRLAQVEWDRGGSSWVFVAVLARAGREQGRAAS